MIFYSDLDNTLIYSYKHDLGKEKCCVEIYEGREISFMTEYSYRLLQEVNKKVLFVPVTTRTIQQYQRIDLGIGTPKYALVCNGGILLVNGEADPDWYLKSRELVSDCQQELHRAKEILKKDADVDFEVRNIEHLFLFTKSARPERTVRNLQNMLSHFLVDIFSNGVKVYVVPKMLTKGQAVRRFQERMQKEAGFAAMLQGKKQTGSDCAIETVAAGDSEFDIPMLLEANVALMPKEMQRKKLKKEAVFYSGKDRAFSDFALDFVNGAAGGRLPGAAFPPFPNRP